MQEVSRKRPVWHYAAVASFAFVIIALFISLKNKQVANDSNAVFEVAFIPFSNLDNKSVISLDDNGNFDFSPLAHLETERFIATAELEYPKIAKEHPFVLVGQLRNHNQKTHLDFLLKGPFGEWQGQLMDSSVDSVIKQLQRHLKQPFIFDLLAKPQSPELKQAILSIAHQEVPDDLIILGKLINTYLEISAYENAMVMADKLVNLAQSQNNIQQIGNAYLYQSTILTRKELYELSSQKLQLAAEQFKKINDLKRQADAWNAQSWIDHQRGDYAAVKSSLLKSAELALATRDIERELHALTYLSVMAHKNSQENDKYLYLRQAENKMKDYNLPAYRFAKVPFHYAIFAKNPPDKEPHLKQVLEYTKLTPDHWVAQDSRGQLLRHYIAQERFAEARALVKNISSDNAQNSYLKTVLAKAENKTDLFVSHAQRTFEQAQLAGNRYLSLEVALLLYGEKNTSVNHDFYLQYISENATERWRRVNESKLIALNL